MAVRAIFVLLVNLIAACQSFNLPGPCSISLQQSRLAASRFAFTRCYLSNGDGGGDDGDGRAGSGGDGSDGRDGSGGDCNGDGDESPPNSFSLMMRKRSADDFAETIKRGLGPMVQYLPRRIPGFLRNAESFRIPGVIASSQFPQMIRLLSLLGKDLLYLHSMAAVAGTATIAYNMRVRAPVIGRKLVAFPVSLRCHAFCFLPKELTD